LAGFSFGTVVGTFAAVQQPRRFRRLVLFGTPILP
jgi:pimeloyl-ACP methyl ester carboxylesterase